MYKQFLEVRKRGKKVSFLWFWIKGKKIAQEIKAPMFTRSAAQDFIKKYNLKVRRVQRKKQQDKTNFLEDLLVIGDFNLDTDKESVCIKKIEDIIQCKQQITKATTKQNTTIDLAFTNFPTTPGIIESYFSYHKLITVTH